MRDGDTFVSAEVMQDGERLERVINKGGQPYSLILVNGVELASCPTQDEDMMPGVVGAGRPQDVRIERRSDDGRGI